MTTGTNRPEMRDVAAALADILDLVPPVTSEMVPVAEAAGRVLAEKVTARVSHPGLTVSAMDGYGVRSEDASAGANLRVTGTIYAGPYQTQQIGPGEAVRLFTGSPLPLGADAVALQENVEPGEGTITLRQAVPAGDYVRPEGFDFRTGEVLLDAPRRLSPEDLALAAASNRDGLRVACRPHVLVLATGAELVLPGTTQGPGQVVASTGFGMAALIERQGGTVILVPPVNDDPAHIRAGIEENPSDIIVTLGGASVGDRDFIARRPRPQRGRPGLPRRGDASRQTHARRQDGRTSFSWPARQPGLGSGLRAGFSSPGPRRLPWTSGRTTAAADGLTRLRSVGKRPARTLYAGPTGNRRRPSGLHALRDAGQFHAAQSGPCGRSRRAAPPCPGMPHWRCHRMH